MICGIVSATVKCEISWSYELSFYSHMIECDTWVSIFWPSSFLLSSLGLQVWEHFSVAVFQGSALNHPRSCGKAQTAPEDYLADSQDSRFGGHFKR